MRITPGTFGSRAVAVAVVVVAGLGLSGCSLINQLTGGGDDVFAIEVGDCLNDATTTGDEVTSVPIVPCDEPHDSEAFASVQMDDGEYPGDTAVSAEADEVCTAEFESFVGVPYEDSKYYYSYYAPTQGSWENRGDREILCTVYDRDVKTTGSLRDAGE